MSVRGWQGPVGRERRLRGSGLGWVLSFVVLRTALGSFASLSLPMGAVGVLAYLVIFVVMGQMAGSMWKGKRAGFLGVAYMLAAGIALDVAEAVLSPGGAALGVVLAAVDAPNLLAVLSFRRLFRKAPDPC